MKLVVAIFLLSFLAYISYDMSQDSKPKKVIAKLSGGEMVECKHMRMMQCGITLSGCINEKEYHCQTDIEITEE